MLYRHISRNKDGEMNDIFDTWKEAHTAAVTQARASSAAWNKAVDYGIEKASPLYGKGKFRVFRLPMPQNRFGFELRCEVVHASDLL
jgi:hypothetical protein